MHVYAIAYMHIHLHVYTYKNAKQYGCIIHLIMDGVLMHSEFTERSQICTYEHSSISAIAQRQSTHKCVLMNIHSWVLLLRDGVLTNGELTKFNEIK